MPSAREGPPQPSRPPASGVGGVHSILPRASRRQPRGGRVAPRAGPSHGLRGQAATETLVHFYAAAPVHIPAAVDKWRVPLSDAALATLERARALDDDSGLVFPSPVRRGQPMSIMTLMKVLRTVGLAERTTVHGFRSSFRDWAAECTDAEHAVMEMSLAHAVGSSVEQAYVRSTLVEKRRALMGKWAAFCVPSGRASGGS